MCLVWKGVLGGEDEQGGEEKGGCELYELGHAAKGGSVRSPTSFESLARRGSPARGRSVKDMDVWAIRVLGHVTPTRGSSKRVSYGVSILQTPNCALETRDHHSCNVTTNPLSPTVLALEKAAQCQASAVRGQGVGHNNCMTKILSVTEREL